jgi:phosphinothricin acetyltransferase
MNIRPATTDDSQPILDIYNHAVLTSTATAEYYAHTLDMRHEWYDVHQEDGPPILVAETEQGQVVGWSSLSKFHTRYGYRFTAEDSVYIAEGWRGQGIGKQLVSPLITCACELNLHTIIASIDSLGEASIQLHKSLGFQQVGYMPQIIYKFDRWLDCVYMQLTL